MLVSHLLLPSVFFAQEGKAPLPRNTPERLTLVDAAICERIDDRLPVNQAVVFSMTLEEIVCYTAFDPVPEETVIYHEWYRKDTHASRIKLKLSPPRWATISRIQLREADKGPWRVEIVDDQGKVYRTLRFSITD